MRIEAIRTLTGPNVYSHGPVIIARLDLEGLTDKESLEFEGFNERLLARLPGLRGHRCSKGRAGGFVERLREGTYFAHVAEHVALDEVEALRSELGRLRAGEVVVFFYDKLEPALKLLAEFGAKQTTAMREPDFDGAEQAAQAATAIGA